MRDKPYTKENRMRKLSINKSDADKRGNKRAKADGQEQTRYTAAEEKIILAIAQKLRAGEEAENRIGELVEKLVAKKGGIKYSDKTIERIATYPGLDCSQQYLRLCWHLHLLTTNYKGRISADINKVCRSAKLKIARLLKLQDNETEMLVIIDYCIHKTLARSLAVDDVDEMVSRRLAEFGKLRKTPEEKKPKTPAADAKVVATDEFDLIDIADSISYMSDPEKFDVHRISSAETRMGLTRLISELVSISRRLPDGGPNQDLGNALVKKGRELEEIGRQLLEPSESHMEGK